MKQFLSLSPLFVNLKVFCNYYLNFLKGNFIESRKECTFLTHQVSKKIFQKTCLLRDKYEVMKSTDFFYTNAQKCLFHFVFSMIYQYLKSDSRWIICEKSMSTYDELADQNCLVWQSIILVHIIYFLPIDWSAFKNNIIKPKNITCYTWNFIVSQWKYQHWIYLWKYQFLFHILISIKESSLSLVL